MNPSIHHGDAHLSSWWNFSIGDDGAGIRSSFSGDNCLIEHYREMHDSLKEVICKAIPSEDFIGKDDRDMFEYACREEMRARDVAIQAKNTVDNAIKQKKSEDEIQKLRQDLVLKEGHYKQAETLSYSSSICILDRLMKNEFIGNGSLDEILAPYMILAMATPEKLAEFSNNGLDIIKKALVDEMLDNVPLMIEIVLAGGAKDGKYGESLLILSNIMSSSSILSREDKEQVPPILKNIALGTSLEHAAGINIFDTNEIVDPVARYLHYERAYLNNELDPCLDHMPTWECRYITNSDARDDQAMWCRKMLRNYRPDQVVMDNYSWRYCQIVRSDVRYKTPEWKVRPKTYQDLISGGGKW